MGVKTNGFIVILLFVSTCSAENGVPVIIDNPKDLLVPVHKPATLICRATGRPTPTITWYKDGLPMRPSLTHHYLLMETGDLFILNVLNDLEKSDVGLYWCVASNSKGNARSKNATLEVAVLESTFFIMPDDTQVLEGETAMLSCVPPNGNPYPVVTWQKDGEDIDPPPSNNGYRYMDGTNLVIPAARPSDAGAYTCIAKNVYGIRASPTAILNILVPPHFVETLELVNGKAGENVTLLCYVEGNPKPKVVWKRVTPNDKLPSERMVLEERSQILRIQQVTPADSGNYSCTAENPTGILTANISLNVLVPPHFVETPGLIYGKDGYKFSLLCHVEGNPQPKIAWRRVTPHDQMPIERVVLEERSQILRIQQVTTADSGIYSCIAVN